jgi:hypothetical protein
MSRPFRFRSFSKDIEEIEQDDDRNWNADQPEQYAFHHILLLLIRTKCGKAPAVPARLKS